MQDINVVQTEPVYRVRPDGDGGLIHDMDDVYAYSLRSGTPKEKIEEIAQDMVIGKRPDLIKYYNPEANAENKALNDYYNAYKKAYDDGSW